MCVCVWVGIYHTNKYRFYIEIVGIHFFRAVYNNLDNNITDLKSHIVCTPLQQILKQ